MHLGLDAIAGVLLWGAEIACFFLSIFYKPAIGLYLLIPLLPLQTIRYRLHEFPLGAQFIDILLLGVILGLKRQGGPVLAKTPLNGMFLVLIGYTYLSMIRGSFSMGAPLPFWFSDPRMSDWKNYMVVVPLILCLTVSAIRTKRDMAIMMIAMGIGALLVAKNFHNMTADRDYSVFSYDGREAGTLGGAGVNGVAAFCAQTAVFFVALFLNERRWRVKLPHLCVFAAMVYCVVFALSRGGYAAFLVGILFLGLFRSKLLLVVLVVFLSFWQVIVPPAVSQRVYMTRSKSGEVESSAAERLTLWDEAMTIFKADPIFGIGFNTYAYGEHAGGYRDTHNLYVKVLVETGVVGICLFLLLMRKLFQIGFRLYRTATDPFLSSIGLGFAALIATAFVANLFGDRWMYYQITGYTFAFAGLAWRAQQMTDEDAETAETEEPTLDASELQLA